MTHIEEGGGTKWRWHGLRARRVILKLLRMTNWSFSVMHLNGPSFHGICRVLQLVVLVAGVGVVHAQTYPVRPITIIVPFAAGSAADQLARGLAQVFTTALANNAVVVVDNRPGASGIIAAQSAARAPADGYTLFYTTNTTQSANQFLFKKLPYDPVADFSPISAVATGAMVLTVPVMSQVKSVTDFIALARRNQVNFGAGNSSSRIAGELFKQLTGANLTYVPYKSNPQAIADLVGGQLDAMFADTASALPLIKAGKLRAIAFTGSRRSPTLPLVPTIEESGVSGYSLSYWGALYAPRGTSREIVNLLNSLIASGVRSEQFKQLLTNTGLDAFTTSPDELAKFQLAEAQKWGRIIKNAEIVAE